VPLALSVVGLAPGAGSPSEMPSGEDLAGTPYAF
jgi:hypothetical protein